MSSEKGWCGASRDDRWKLLHCWQIQLGDQAPALRPKSPRLDGAEAEADPPGAGGGAPVLVSWTRWTRGSVSPGNPTICVRLCVDRFCEEELDIPHEWRAAC